MGAPAYLYLYFQDGGEGFSVLRDPSDVERSGENRRVVVLIVDVDHHLCRVGWDTQTHPNVSNKHLMELSWRLS